MPDQGSLVRLRRVGLLTDGEVVWQASGYLGLRFVEEIDVDVWVKRVGHRGQQRVDELIAEVRRQPHPAVAPSPPGTEAYDTLVAVSADLAEVCKRLAAIPELADQAYDDFLRLGAIAHRLNVIVTRTSATD